MKPVDVKWNTYIDLNVEKNDKDPKLKVGDHARTSKHRSTIAKELKKQSREKNDKLYVKRKDCDNLFNSWIDKKYILIWNELFSRTIYPKQKQNESWIRFG